VVFGSFLPDAITAVNVCQGTLRLDYLDSQDRDFGPIAFATPVTLGGAGLGGRLEINEAIRRLEGLQPVQQPLASLSFAGLGSTVTGTGTLRLYNPVSGTYNSGTTHSGACSSWSSAACSTPARPSSYSAGSIRPR